MSRANVRFEMASNDNSRIEGLVKRVKEGFELKKGALEEPPELKARNLR
jgi:hypothetical protein